MPRIPELNRVPCRCGGKAFLNRCSNPESCNYKDWKVICSECQIQTNYRKTQKEAVKVWNKTMGENAVKVIYVADTIGHGAFGECPECGAEVNEYFVYCPNCGVKLEWL